MEKLTRRSVLSGAAAGLTILSTETACTYRANSRATFGVIGTGRRGCFVGAIMAKDPNAQLAGICDVYPDRIEQAKQAIPDAHMTKVYGDYNEMLAQPGIDAVLIATPVFLHPVHFAAAVKAKKHIYCEKPCGANVAGVKQSLAAAMQADPSKTIQWGFQQRFSPEYLTAYSEMKQGKIGDMKLMMSYWVLANMLMGSLGPKLPPEEEKIRRWEFWREYGGGPIVEQDCHGLDVMNWFAGNHPLKAAGTGSLRYPLAYGDWTSDHHHVTFTYPNGIEGQLISAKSRHVVAYRDVKEQFFGTEGMLETSRTNYRRHSGVEAGLLKSADDLRDRSVVEQRTSKREITYDAAEVFFKSIVEHKPFSTAQAAADSSFTAMLGRMAFETKREVTWEEMLASEELPT